MKLNPIITRVLFPAFAKIQDDTAKLRVNFYKLLSVVGIINFPALLGLMVVSNNFVPLVFGEKWVSIIPVLQLLCVVGRSGWRALHLLRRLCDQHPDHGYHRCG